MRKCSTAKRSIAIASFEDRDKFALCVGVSEAHCIACKRVVEGRRDVFAMSLHAGVFVRAGIEASRDEDEGGLWGGRGGFEEACGFGEEDAVFGIVETLEVGSEV